MKTKRPNHSILLLAAAIFAILQHEALAEENYLSGAIYVVPDLTYVKSNSVSGSYVAERFGRIESVSVLAGTNSSVASPQLGDMYREAYYEMIKGETSVINLYSLTNSFGDILKMYSVNLLSFKAATNSTLKVSGSFSSWVGESGDSVVLNPGGVLFMFAPSSGGYAVSPDGTEITIENLTADLDGVFGIPGIGIDADDTKMKTTNSFVFSISNSLYTNSATTNIAFSASETVGETNCAYETFGVWALQIGTNNAISTKAPSTNMLYTNAVSAENSVPSADVGNILIGYVVIKSQASNVFTAGTTSLSTNNSSFHDVATNGPTYAGYEAYIAGVADPSGSSYSKLVKRR